MAPDATMDDTPRTSIQARIAALRLDQVGRNSPPDAAAAKKKPPPPLPKRPAGDRRTESVPVPPTANRTIGNTPSGAVPAPSGAATPPLPPRRSSITPTNTPPALPSRPPSRVLRNQSSASSLASTLSNRTTTSVNSQTSVPRIRAPEYDPAILPPLPERRNTGEAERIPLRPTVSAPGAVPRANGVPKLPSRPPLPARRDTQDADPAPIQRPRRSPLDYALNKSTGVPPPVPVARPEAAAAKPPPVPLASKPNVAAQAAQPIASKRAGECLKCRDFSAVDAHAARFPREAIPSHDVGWLARALTEPFNSDTDKARAIFTWLHHNVAYDTQAFFSGNLQASTPAGTVASGLAVCEGYAGLYAALAAKAGLQAVVVGGDGKGYGHTPLGPGDPVPPRGAANHAWSAVRIDGGEWKLLDACWGAGVVNGPNEPYKKSFNPSQFTMSNDEFGLTHYPFDDRYFFRDDGRRTISWEEYKRSDAGGEPVTVYTGAQDIHGFDDKSFEPHFKAIPVNGPEPSVRFAWHAVCAHWDHEARGHGKPYLFLIELKDDKGEPVFQPVQSDGYWWWADVSRRDLERVGRGRDVKAMYLQKRMDRDGRGLTIKEWESGYPRGKWRQGNWTSWQFNSVACWTLV
ncbi:hypothetical protein EJ06DRAFT_532840 [Trichodelitschia bisporula]|uniref:Transglutaminase-like domain-containing protein n=1 Tax=Trichodelitschia bisporula TaxID=703511 RepID=A0A6G1HPK4_9PEZI|nr:hypothetical protein EJ06DRAFT_532840 [Trichodelitschia bisporula]